jgi:hypothetical protein
MAVGSICGSRRGKNSGKRWVFVYRRPHDGKRCEIGLGGTVAVGLAKAREKAGAARALLADGKDPKAQKSDQDRKPTCRWRIGTSEPWVRDGATRSIGRNGR